MEFSIDNNINDGAVIKVIGVGGGGRDDGHDGGIGIVLADIAGVDPCGSDAVGAADVVDEALAHLRRFGDNVPHALPVLATHCCVPGLAAAGCLAAELAGPGGLQHRAHQPHPGPG